MLSVRAGGLLLVTRAFKIPHPPASQGPLCTAACDARARTRGWGAGQETLAAHNEVAGTRNAQRFGRAAGGAAPQDGEGSKAVQCTHFGE